MFDELSMLVKKERRAPLSVNTRIIFGIVAGVVIVPIGFVYLPKWATSALVALGFAYWVFIVLPDSAREAQEEAVRHQEQSRLQYEELIRRTQQEAANEQRAYRA